MSYLEYGTHRIGYGVRGWWRGLGFAALGMRCAVVGTRLVYVVLWVRIAVELVVLQLVLAHRHLADGILGWWE